MVKQSALHRAQSIAVACFGCMSLEARALEKLSQATSMFIVVLPAAVAAHSERTHGDTCLLMRYCFHDDYRPRETSLAVPAQPCVQRTTYCTPYLVLGTPHSSFVAELSLHGKRTSSMLSMGQKRHAKKYLVLPAPCGHMVHVQSAAATSETRRHEREGCYDTSLGPRMLHAT